ncbi:MAG: DUF3309 family protein [FCB group bacterium]|jgi:hypothetical protein|nr:DUF3309 family protein [FCB group bacterium]
MLQLLLATCLLLLVLAAVPAWPYNRTWGFLPSGIIGAILAMLIVSLAVGAA